MGYSLAIGELTSIIDDDNGEERPYVECVKHDDAPAFDEPTDYTNQRWPSYTSWADFAEGVGLSDLLLDTLIPEHPGIAPILPEHLDMVKRATLKMKQRFKGIGAADGSDEGWWLMRLVWLEYWMKWALENCKQPTFYNS